MMNPAAHDVPVAETAWRGLEARLRPFIARRLRAAEDVDDVIQEVFLRMSRGLSGLRDDERFGPWVYQVARSAIVDHLRTRARHPIPTHEAPEPSTAELEEEPTVEQELAAYIVPFIAMLPSPYREALTLTELNGQTQKEAATMLGISVSGMKSRVQRGRQMLRATLESACEIALDGRGRVLACEPRKGGRAPDGCCR